MAVTSCGVVIYDKEGKILIGHMTNGRYWDFPKGKREEGETDAQAAIRETLEESSLSLDITKLKTLSLEQPYRKGKRLSLYSYYLEDIDLSKVECTSLVSGSDFLELDAFKLVSVEEIFNYISPAMTKYLNNNDILYQYNRK